MNVKQLSKEQTVDIGVPEFPNTPPREKPKKGDTKPKFPNGDRRCRNLYKALLQAQRDVQEVEKDATTEFPYKYDYVSAEAIIKEARRVLLPNGLIALRPGWHAPDPAAYQLPGDDCCLIGFVCEIRHPESGEVKVDHVVFPAIQGKGRPWDKAIAAALTSGWAYWLRDQLQIPRVDASMDSRDDSAFDPSKAYGDPLPQKEPATSPTSLTDQLMASVAATRKPSGAGKSLGPVPAEYWVHKRAASDPKQTATRDGRLLQMTALLPHREAKTRKEPDGSWVFYLPGSKDTVSIPVSEAAEVSVGSMFGEKESELPF